MARRLGREDSQTRTALMNAVETVMLNEGYAALSARGIARCAGLNYQLVFYYFEKIDDLFLATYRRRTGRIIDQLEQALQSEQPLHELWKASANPDDAALSLEYMAMSNHNPAIREETIRHSDRIIQLISDLVAKRLAKGLPDPEIFTPSAVGMAVALIANSFGFQSALGISRAVPETARLVEWCLDRLEPPEGG